MFFNKFRYDRNLHEVFEKMKELKYEIEIEEVEYRFSKKGEENLRFSDKNYKFVKKALEDYQKAKKMIENAQERNRHRRYLKEKKYEEELKRNNPIEYQKLMTKRHNAMIKHLNAPCLLFGMLPKTAPLKEGYRARK